MPAEDIPGCCFDDWAACNSKRARKRETAAAITAALLSALDEAGLEGRSVLDVGCGTGDLALGALADERGLAERAAFGVGDGSQAGLPKSDVVVLNRVVCCYPSADALLVNTLGAAGSVFAPTAPVDRGLMGFYNRIFCLVGNGWYAIRSKKFRGFRVFVHDLAAIDRIIMAGFRPMVRQPLRLVWDLRVFECETQ